MNDKDLQFLTELGRKMNAQDNRMTQFPMFQIRHKVKRYLSYDMDWDEKERNFDGGGEICEKCEENYADGEGDDYPNDCDECDVECFRYFVWEDEIVNNCGNFFTEEAAEEHIRLNHYYYYEPYTYAIGSWRNEELQEVLNILSRLGSDNGEAKNYYE